MRYRWCRNSSSTTSEGVPPCSGMTSPNVALVVCAWEEKGRHRTSAAAARRMEPERVHLGFTRRYPFQTRRNYSVTQTLEGLGSCGTGAYTVLATHSSMERFKAPKSMGLLI